MRNFNTKISAALATAFFCAFLFSVTFVFAEDFDEEVSFDDLYVTSSRGPGPFEGACVGVYVPHILKHNTERLGSNILAKEKIFLGKELATKSFLTGAVNWTLKNYTATSVAIVRQAPNQFVIHEINIDLAEAFAPETYPVGSAIVGAFDKDSIMGNIVGRDVKHRNAYRSTPLNIEIRSLELVALIAANSDSINADKPLQHMNVWSMEAPDEDFYTPFTARKALGDVPVTNLTKAGNHHPVRKVWFCGEGPYNKFFEYLLDGIFRFGKLDTTMDEYDEFFRLSFDEELADFSPGFKRVVCAAISGARYHSKYDRVDELVALAEQIIESEAMENSDTLVKEIRNFAKTDSGIFSER